MNAFSRQDALAIVDDIRESNGGINPADRQKTPPGVLRSLENVRRKLGAATRTLATNLYSKNTRFVFELIQNAEDNQYTRATTADEEPLLSFAIHPDRIVIDSNEDGFVEANVRAICSTGESTKENSLGYIGEKGIGFKSVFKVASKVHIQSGAFSFYFEHEHGDDGLGMVTPVYEEHKDLPPDVRTRMILTLSNTSDYDKHVKEFHDLPDTLLLFLTKLKRITIAIFDVNRHLSTTTYSYRYHEPSRQGSLTKLSVSDSYRREVVNNFHITKRTVVNLPDDPARIQTNQAEVVLAFPLGNDSVPVIEQQQVFAYLPLRSVGFNFLIQSDFITQASREDVFQSPWNEAILDGVAETFRDAVLQFCKHGSLQFQWMDYLPNETISEQFWAQLLPKIVRLLKQTSILRPRDGGHLKRPSQLKRLPDQYRDQGGGPLFRDLSEKLYLSPEYQREALDKLGVQFLDWEDALIRIRADLEESSSKMKLAWTDDDWHTRAAKFLMTPLQRRLSVMDDIRRLQLVPLQNGQWISSHAGSIYYPDNDSIAIPTDLGLRLVEPKALTNASRKKLFSKLGVRECIPKDVVELILGKYYKWNNASLQSSITDLRYLYWNLPKDELGLNKFVYLKDHDEISVFRTWPTFGIELIKDDLYFELDDEYGVKQLSKPTSYSYSGHEIMAPGFSVHFLNSAYLAAVSPEARRHGLSWEDWLEKFAEIRRIPRLVRSANPPMLSDLFLYIVEKRKDRFLSTLKAHWSSYNGLMTPEIVTALSKASVHCEHVVDMPLESTYLPLPKLKELCRELGADRKLPFLQLPVELNEESEQEWAFLRKFHVGYEANLDFYLDVLRQIIHGKPLLSEELIDCLFRVYEAIEEHSKAADYERVRKLFVEEAAIYVPTRASLTAAWAKPDECVWKAPDFLDKPYPLAATDEYRGNERLTRLFNSILCIPNANWRHYVDHIDALALKEEVSHASVLNIYRHMWRDVSTREDWDNINEYFEDWELVFVCSQQKWYPPSSCLWTDTTRISGKVAIGSEYANLQEFFVDRLGVEQPNLSMFIDELKLLSTGEAPSIQKVKELIIDINSWGPQKGALDELNSFNILPVRGKDDRLSLKNTRDDFAIVNLLEYGDTFKGKIAILDFTIEEVRALRLFISALGLESRYMSETVEESSTVTVSSREPTLSDEIKQKAYALFRCAVHYESFKSQDHSLYRQLQETNVFESDGILKTVTLSHQGSPIVVEGAKGNLHIEQDNNQVRLYVPRNRRDRELCYLTQLPKKLVAHLAITDTAAVKIFGDVLKASPLVLDDVLKDHGIVQVPGVEPFQPTAPGGTTGNLDETEREERDNDEEDSVATLSASSHPQLPSTSRLQASSLFGGNNTTSSGSEDGIFPLRAQSPIRPSSTPSSTPSSFPAAARQEVISRPFVDNAEYIALLDHVITSSSQARFPPSAPSSFAPLFDPAIRIFSDTVFGIRSQNPTSHDKKVGAAGELYVFELLMGLDLPNFGLPNWESTIRKEVCVHEKYNNMAAWTGAETADITYDDAEGVFTERLISLGYLPRETWQGAGPKYYLEVKTTPKESETRFWMIKAQYQRMQRMVLTPGQRAAEVYVILRVFNLSQGRIGMRLYVDPETMRRNGELRFAAETYTVIPSSSRFGSSSGSNLSGGSPSGFGGFRFGSSSGGNLSGGSPSGLGSNSQGSISTPVRFTFGTNRGDNPLGG